MESQLQLGEVEVSVRFKDIKNLHLSTHPPTGRVTIAAPHRTNLETIRLFAISKLPWINRQQKKLADQDRESRRELVDQESHHLWGRRYLLRVIPTLGAPKIEVAARHLELKIKIGTPAEKRMQILESWYREEIRKRVPQLTKKWSRVLGVSPKEVLVRRMKTRWGSCVSGSGNIVLNTELAKKPPACLEYVLVHELIHLRHPNHGNEFKELMNRNLAGWKSTRKLLNSLPVRHEDWTY